MIIDPDYLIERKYYKLQLKKWKLITLLLIIILLVFLGLKTQEYKGITGSKLGKDYIASIRIEDIIMEDKKLDNTLIKIKDDNKAKALILYINSPGGTVVGSERAYKILRSIASNKPIVVVLGTIATSGGYMIALAGDHIISHQGTMTGSIGVIMQTAEVTELARKLGIKFHSFKSGELKASPNPLEELTPAVEGAIMATVQDMYSFFVDLVVERRKIDKNKALQIADGRIYSGRQALSLNLVDALGTMEDAVTWLQKEKNLSSDLEVVDMTTKPKLSIIEILKDNMSELFSGIYNRKIKGFITLF